MNSILFTSLCTLVFALMLPLISLAQDESGINKNLENMAGRYAECAAYYELVYHAMNASNNKDTAAAYKQLEDNAMFYSLLLASEGRSKEVAVKVTNSRIDMYVKKMKQEAHSRNENISILISKYHFGCEEVMKNLPSEVLEALEARADEASRQNR